MIIRPICKRGPAFQLTSSIQMDFKNIEKSDVVSRKRSFRFVNRKMLNYFYYYFFLFFLYKSNFYEQDDSGLFSDLQLELYKSELYNSKSALFHESALI